MRLIDADALMKVIDQKFQEHYGNSVYQFIHDFFTFVLRQISKAPTIDAVPVVRCGECKHWACFMNNPDGTLFGNCECYSNDFRNEGDFCSYGEWKDGDANG